MPPGVRCVVWRRRRAGLGDWPLFNHVLPFHVARAHEELSGVEHPTVWTAGRDTASWNALRG